MVSDLNHEEKILREIITEFGGTFLPDEINAWFSRKLSAELIRSNYISRVWRISNRFFGIKVGGDTLDHAVDIQKSTLDKVRTFIQNTPEVVDGCEEGIWINTYDLCHGGHTESAAAVDGDDGMFKCIKFVVELYEDDIAANRRNVAGITGPLIAAGGPLHGNFHFIIWEIKKRFDPNNIANPPMPFVLKEGES